MKEKRQNVLEHLDDIDLLVIPSGSTVNNGKLDMAIGIAREVTKIWDGIDSYFGEYIDNICGSDGLFWYARHPSLPIALIQVKTKSSFRSVPKLACDSLYHIRLIAESQPETTIGLIIPERIVESIPDSDMASLPDNVVRYK